jgi:hypothetical protein
MAHEIYYCFHTVSQTTKVAITYNIVMFLIVISRSVNPKLRADNMTQNCRHSCLSPHIMLQQMLKLYGKAQRCILKFMETLNRYYV